jgi:hypothetical protein
MTSADSGALGAPPLPDYAPVPRASLGPAVNDQGYYVGRIERNLYWVTDGDYHSAFMTAISQVAGLLTEPIRLCSTRESWPRPAARRARSESRSARAAGDAPAGHSSRRC